MDRKRADEIAAQIVAENPRLDGIAQDARLWLLNDIARELVNAYTDGRVTGQSDITPAPHNLPRRDPRS